MLKYKYDKRKRNVYEKEKGNIPDSINNNNNSSNKSSSSSKSTNKSSKETATSTDKININTASLDELQKISGIKSLKNRCEAPTYL